jgi:predicted metal-dependent peptidase
LNPVEIERKISKARAGLILDQPFFGALALRLQVTADPTCRTAWTDGAKFGYNPEWIDSLTLPEVKALWAHEVMHNACAHHVRRDNRGPAKWNQAADYAINGILENSGFDLPPGALLNPAYQDKTAEEIYNLLPEPDPGAGTDPGGTGEVRDATDEQGRPLQAQGQAQETQNWKVAITQAAQQARACGNLPADLARLVNDIVHPKLNPYEILRQFLEMSARNDYSWTPPNRRYISQGFYLPSLRSLELPAVVIAVDTSGSIDEQNLAQFSAEISGILEAYETEITVIYCDSGINGEPEIFTREDLPLKLQARGGGGTDFRPPFEYVDAHELTPACLIYLTDLDCHSYPRDPGYPVLWARIGKYGNNPPFGDVVEID